RLGPAVVPLDFHLDAFDDALAVVAAGLLRGFVLLGRGRLLPGGRRHGRYGGEGGHGRQDQEQSPGQSARHGLTSLQDVWISSPGGGASKGAAAWAPGWAAASGRSTPPGRRASPPPRRRSPAPGRTASRPCPPSRRLRG